jgi:formate-dependent nitrite reductase cytochrome c552 subunit
MRHRENAMMKRVLLLVLMALVALSMNCRTLHAEEIVCITCHSALPGKYGEPVKLWKGSIHAGNGIACNACHGGDPRDAANAMKKERGFLGAPKYNDVPQFCGRCHVGVLKDYLASAHGRALASGGPNCVICHGSHQIVKASLELINEKACSRCHSYERAKVIRGAMQETEAIIVALDARIAGYKEVGTDTDRLEKELFSQRNRFHSLFHNVDVKRVTAESTQIQAELKKIETALKALDDQKGRRKLAGAIAVAVLLVAALLTHLIRKTYE